MRILFMGTPDIAAKCLESLISSNNDVIAVFTRQDKPVGRKHILTAPPVKQVALQNDIKVFQPVNFKDEIAVNVIKELNPDIIVVVAYGRILPKEVLDIPKYGCINLHVSLLPKYRGAAPIQWSVINGDSVTGVTIMQMDEGLDTGDIITVEQVEIDENITSGELFEKVTMCGANLLVNTLVDIEQNKINKIKQDEEKVTYAPPLTKEMAQISFDMDNTKLHNLIRGLNPWPIAYYMDNDKKVKITKSAILDKTANIGEIVSTKPLTVGCKKGCIVLNEVVPEGKKPMDGTSFVAGKRLKIGDKLV